MQIIEKTINYEINSVCLSEKYSFFTTLYKTKVIRIMYGNTTYYSTSNSKLNRYTKQNYLKTKTKSNFEFDDNVIVIFRLISTNDCHYVLNKMFFQL